jgi:hypothetical protein
MRTGMVLYIILVVMVVGALGFMAVNTDGITGLLTSSDILDDTSCEENCENICDTSDCVAQCITEVCVTGGSILH